MRNIEAPLAFQLDLRKLANFNVSLVPGRDRGPKLSSACVQGVPKALREETERMKGAGKRYFARLAAQAR